MRGSNRPKRAKRFGFSLDSFGRNKLSRFAIFVSILAGSIGRAVYLNHRFKDKGLIGTKIKASNRVKKWNLRKDFHLKIIRKLPPRAVGIGCCSVGRAVTSDNRGLQFESNDRQNLRWTIFTFNLIQKTKTKEKRCREWPF